MRLALFCLLILVACTPAITPIPEELPGTPQDQPLRPDIPRTYEPPPPSPIAGEQPSGGSVLLPEPDPIPRLELEVPFGEPIGRRHALITQNQFPLLKHHAIPMDSGRIFRYLEELRFDFKENSTGIPRFGIDPDTDEIGTFLYFAPEKPIFEYRVILEDGTWFDLEGHEIQLLGHTYIVTDVTNNSVSFFGIDVPQAMLFSENDRLVIDNMNQRDTLAHVYRDGATYTLFTNGDDADRSILLSAGESLTDNLKQTQLASKLFDIRYAGANSAPAVYVRFAPTKHGYDLEIETPSGTSRIPLVEQDGGEVFLGTLESKMHIAHCPRNTYCIAPGDSVLFSGPETTHVLTYTDLSVSPQRIFMHEPRNSYEYEIVGDLHKNAWTDIILDEAAWRARVHPQANSSERFNLSIDLPKDAVVHLAGDYALDLHPVVNDSVLVELVVPRSRTINRTQERISFHVTWDGEWKIAVEGIEMVGSDETHVLFGQTSYGVAAVLDQEKRTLSANEGVSAELLIPIEQTMAIVRLEG